MAPVSVFQLICSGTRSPRKQLVAHADSENRLVSLHCLAETIYGHLAELRIAGTVGNEESVIVEAEEIIVPWHPYKLDASVHEAAEDIVLDSAVHEDDFLLSGAVADDFLAAHYVNLVVEIRVVNLFRRRGILSVRNNDSEHRSILSQDLGKFPCINAVDTRYLLLLEPLIEALDGIPVAVLERIFGNDESPDPDFFRFEIEGDAIGVCSLVRHAVIADDRVGHTKNLSRVGRVGKAFRISHHCRGEHDLTVARLVVSE